VTKVIKIPISHLEVISSPQQESQPTALSQLKYAEPTELYLRDGEVVLFRRPNSPLWQCRFKRHDNTWDRVSTKQASIEHAVRVACDLYDEARFRQRLGLAQKAPTFAEIAHATLYEMRRDLGEGIGKSVYLSYITCIEKYFLPYFMDKRLEEITYTDVHEFEIWRNRQMRLVPKSSTLMNFASAWAKLQQTAVNKGWISDRVAIPKLTTRGHKGKTRPAFSREEITKLFDYMERWAKEGRLEIEREIRPLVRDYVEMLLLTGMRHGTEALNICWNNIEWHTNDGKKYLRIWVDGKTGGRWLIAKHRAVDVLKRLHSRQKAVYDIRFDRLFEVRVPQRVFVMADGHQPLRIDGTFKKLMRDSGLGLSQDGQMRTLYSLRHTYATLELLENKTDIHTLAKQMGNSAAMIERHYSKLTPTMAAEQLA
jgi:integrase